MKKNNNNNILIVLALVLFGLITLYIFSKEINKIDEFNNRRRYRFNIPKFRWGQ